MSKIELKKQLTVDQLRKELIQTKDEPLNKRTGITYSASIGLLYTYPGLDRNYTEGYIEDLKISIEEKGMIQKPLATLKFDETDKLQLNNIYVVCGNARVWAAKDLGLEQVEMTIKYLTPDESFDLSLTENDERDQLNPIDRANTFQNWIEKTGIKQYEIARKRGYKTPSLVSQTLRLLTLPAKVQLMIREKKISFLEAQRILKIGDPNEQIKLAELCSEGLSNKALDLEIEKRKLKSMNINILMPDASSKPVIDRRPDSPVIVPSKIILPKPSDPQTEENQPQSPIELGRIYFRKGIEEISKANPSKDAIKPFICLDILCNSCSFDCKKCKSPEICSIIVNTFQEKAGIKFPIS
jgi:ParB/RepB/Spo0J family partition protein